jgi:putative phosphoesterase
MKLGIISDTHGYLPAAVLKHLAAVDTILHAGDIGDPGIISELEIIAPVYAISGNIDSGEVSRNFPPTRVIELGGYTFFLIHNIVTEKFVRYELFRKKIQPHIIVHGHTHQPELKRHSEILFINPGSVSKPKQNQMGTIVLLDINNQSLEPKIIQI